MIYCPVCNSECSDSSAFCIKCGAFFGKTLLPTEEERLFLLAQPPASELLVAPRPHIINRPWTKDWVFWLPVVLTTIGGSQSLFREGSLGLGPATAFTYSSGFFTILFLVPASFFMFGVLPALIRWPFRTRSFKKRLAIRPEDESAGWKRDPFDISSQRWWTGSLWTRGTRPQKDEKVGIASFLIIIGVVAAMSIAFLAGTGSRGFDANPGITNSDNGDFLDTLESIESANSFDEGFATSVADAYSQVTQELNDYYAVQIDLQNIIPAYIQLQEIVNSLQTSQSELQGLLTATTTQEMLGGSSAPDVDALRDFTAALGNFVSNRMNFYQELEACEPLLTPGREVGICDEDAFARWETLMTGDLEPLGSSYQSVLDSMKSE